uniref:NADH-ubiquinone oxidoreductase chain 4L n=1 Tax=Criotettix japonicus TaxID=2793210 RepID=A0A7U3STR3_9ORTH|nr:NADH dehydrogenase subunit 4L [Criotettix japonicus]
MMLIYLFMIFFSGFYVFSSFRKHLLLMLLGLEYMVLGLFIFIFFYLNIYGYVSYFLVIYLIFSVCEGVLGLSVLVSMVRNMGNDYLISSYLFLC